MTQRERNGVVDAHLNVYGVQGLKVAGTINSTLLILWLLMNICLSDMSIAPSNVAAVSVLQ